MKKIFVLIACEESQAECIEFRKLGCIAFSCDLQPCRRNGHPEWHVQGDCRRLLSGDVSFKTQDGKRHYIRKWTLVVAHPPCTYLCKVSSVLMRKNADYYVYFRGKIMKVNKNRYNAMLDAKSFFFKMFSANCDYLCVENPQPMALAELGKPDCYIQPSWFGVKYTKKTLYWLRNLPPIMAEIEYPNPKSFVRCSSGKYRSRTFPEVARAMAKQWTEYILKDKQLERIMNIYP